MKRAEILVEAEKCVCGKREQEYGTPEDNFATIGLLWSVYLRAAHPDLQKILPINGINAKDVATMMALLKVARIATGSSQDSFIDLAGYAACAGEIATQTLKQSAAIKNENFCVVCGESIPEGRQYCKEHDFNNGVPKMKTRGARVMGDMKETFKDYREKHRQRVAKNPERIAYATNQLEEHDIEYILKNEATGHFHCYRKTDDALIQFWAGTGKIMGYDNLRGIHNLIKLCEGDA